MVGTKRNEVTANVAILRAANFTVPSRWCLLDAKRAKTTHFAPVNRLSFFREEFPSHFLHFPVMTQVH
jgi:hypothetical protein